jgi:hypothetical protein
MPGLDEACLRSKPSNSILAIFFFLEHAGELRIDILRKVG